MRNCKLTIFPVASCLLAYRFLGEYINLDIYLFGCFYFQEPTRQWWLCGYRCLRVCVCDRNEYLDGRTPCSTGVSTQQLSKYSSFYKPSQVIGYWTDLLYRSGPVIYIANLCSSSLPKNFWLVIRIWLGNEKPRVQEASGIGWVEFEQSSKDVI